MEIKVADFILSAEYGENYINRWTTIIIMDKSGKVIGKVDCHELRTAIDALAECRPKGSL